MKVSITEKERRYEEKSRDTVLEKYETTTDEIYQKLGKIVDERDTLSLFKFIQSDLERQKYQIFTAEWAKEKGLSEKIGFLLRLPGLTNEERYVMYTFLAFSKGLSVEGIVDADHPGDLERVIFKVYPIRGNLKEFYYLNTAAHGYPALMKDSLGKHRTLEEAVRNCEIFLQPGDHAMGLLKPDELRTRVYAEKVYKKILNSSTFVHMYINGLFRVFRRFTRFQTESTPFDAKQYYEFFFLESDELKNFDIDTDQYMELIFDLERRLQEKRKEREKFRLKKNYYLLRNWLAQKLKFGSIKWDDYLQLDKFERILWKTPIFEQDNALSEYRKEELTQQIFSEDDFQVMENLEYHISKMQVRVEQLKRQSFTDQEKYFTSKAIQRFENLSIWGKLAIPSAITELFYKTLWDWAYPEKMPLGKKIFRLFASPSGMAYRLIQKYMISRSF